MPHAYDFVDILGAEKRPPISVRLPHFARTVPISCLLRHKKPWAGDVPLAFRTVPGKPPLDFEGQLLYPEFILLRLLERHSWAGVWVKNWGGRAFWRAIQDPVPLPDGPRDLFARIDGHLSGGGWWDVFA